MPHLITNPNPISNPYVVD